MPFIRSKHLFTKLCYAAMDYGTVFPRHRLIRCSLSLIVDFIFTERRWRQRLIMASISSLTEFGTLTMEGASAALSCSSVVENNSVCLFSGDVVVTLVYKDSLTGSIIRNMSNNQWSKASLVERYRAAEIQGHVVVGLVVYEDCVFKQLADSGSSFVYRQKNVFSVTNENICSIIDTFFFKNVNVTLANALVFKKTNVSVCLHGALTTCGGRTLVTGTDKCFNMSSFVKGVSQYTDLNEFHTVVVPEALDGWFNVNVKPTDAQIDMIVDKFDVSDLKEHLTSASGKIDAMITSAGDKVDVIFAMIMRFFPSEEAATFIKNQGLNFMMFVYEICEAIYTHSVSLPMVLRFAVKAAGIFAIPFELLSIITEQVTKMFNSARAMVFSGASEVVTQGGDDSIGSIIAAIMGVVISGTCLDEKAVKKAGDYSRTFNTLVTSTGKVENLFKGFLEWLPEVIKGYIQYFFPGVCESSMATIRKKLKAVVLEMHETCDAIRRDATIVFDKNFRERAFEIERIVRDIVAESDDYQRDPALRSLITRCVRLEEKFRVCVTDMLLIHNEKDGRPTPYCLTFFGEAGVGKSTVAGAMAYRFAPEGPEGNRVYVRNSTDDFWSGYHNQSVVLLDDLGQETSKCADLLEMFSIVSTATYMPPMASLDNAGIGIKGTKFDSSLIIACTNNPYPRPTNVYKQEALYRRRNLLVEVVVGADVRKRGGSVPDPNAMERDFSHLAFICRDPMDPTKKGPHGGMALNYNQFCEYFVADFNTHQVREKGLYDDCKKGIRTPLVITQGLVSGFVEYLIGPKRLLPCTFNEFRDLAKRNRNAEDYKRILLTLMGPNDVPLRLVVDGDYSTPHVIAYSTMLRSEKHLMYNFFYSLPTVAFEQFLMYEELGFISEVYDDVDLFMRSMVCYMYKALDYFRAYCGEIDVATDLIIGEMIADGALLGSCIDGIRLKRITFYEKHPILMKVLNVAVDVAVFHGIILMTSALVGWLFPSAKKVVGAVESYERSTRDVFSGKRKPVEVRVPKHVISRAQGLVDSVVDVTERDFDSLMEVFCANGLKPMDAEQKARHLLDFCLVAKHNLGTTTLGMCRRGPSMDPLYECLATGFDHQSFHDLAREMRGLKGTSVEVQGMVCDIIGGVTQKDDDCVKHLVALGYDPTTTENAVKLLLPMSNLINSLAKNMDQAGKNRVQAEIKNIVSELFISSPANLALIDGSLSDERFVDGRNVVYSDHCNVLLQGGEDPAAYDLIDNKVLPQMLSITRIRDGKFIRMGCFAMGGKDLIIPHHFFVNNDTGAYIEEGCTFSLEGASKYVVEEEAFSRKRMRQLRYNGNGIDVVVYRCTGRLRSFGKSLHLFIHDDDLKHLNATTASLVACRNNLPTVQLLNMMISNDVIVTEGAASFSTPKSWRYTAPTGAGMCGGLIVAHKNTIPRKFCGMHFAASRTDPVSYGQILSQELLREAVLSLDEEFGVCVTGDMMDKKLGPVGDSRIVLQGAFSLYGTVDPGEEVRTPVKTQIRPSPIHGLAYPVRRAPAPLTPWDERIGKENRGQSMLSKSIEKYGKMSRPFEENLLDECVDDVYDEINAVCSNVPKRIATMAEAINGNIHVDMAERLNLHTSAGYPWSLHKDRGTKGKACWFEGDDVVRTMREDLEEVVMQRIASCEKGERYPSMWTDNLKDELEDLEKVVLGKARTFSIAPMDYTIVFRKYMLFFCAHFMSVKLSTFSAIGINAESRDWTQLMRTLKEKSPVGIAGDYSRWDGVMSAQIMEKVAERVVNRWYNQFEVDEKANLARRVLVDEMIHTPVLAMNLVYGQHGGNPSGNPMTAIINTIVNAVYMRYVFLKLAPVAQRSMMGFHENVKMFIYGDDNILAIKPEILMWFNMHTVSHEFAKLGITYTTADKKSADSSKPYQELEELTFLKRGFSPVGNDFYPLMSKKTIFDLTNWVRDSDDDIASCVENCNTALRFMFFYGEKDFLGFREIVMSCFQKRGMFVPLHSFQYLRRYYDEHHGFPASVDEFGTIKHVVLEAGEGNVDGGIVLPSVAGLDVGSTNEGRPIHKTGVSSSFKSAGDPNWSVADSASKWTYVKTVDWLLSSIATTTVSGSVLDIPFSLLTTAQAAYPFTQFLQWRGGVTIRFSVDGSPFHMGMVRAVFLPLAMNVNFPAAQSSLTQDSLLPHVKIFANSTEDVEFYVPFVNPRDFLSLSDSTSSSWLMNTLGQMVLVVGNQLNVAAGGAPSIPISIYVSFSEDSRFIIPAPRAAIGLRGIGECLLPGEVVRTEMWAGMAATLLEPIVKKILPKEVIADPIHKIGKGRADKPNNTVQPHYVIPRQMGYLSNSTQIEQIERLSYVPSFNDEAEPDDFQITQDETDIDWLLAKKSWANTFGWSTSDASNTVLWTRRIEAFADMYNVLTTTTGAGLEVSLLGHLAALHEKWRGPMEFEIELIGSDYHRGKLFFGVHYGVIAAPTAFATAANQFGVFIDLIPGKRSYTVTVEYNAYTKWLYVGNGKNFDSVATADRSGMGIMSIRVVNQLVAPLSLPNRIEVNVYVGGGKGLQLAEPGLSNCSLRPVFLQGLEGNEGAEEPKIGLSANEDKKPASQTSRSEVALGRGKGVVPAKAGNEGGHTVNNLVDILKKYHPIAPAIQMRRFFDEENYSSIISLHWGALVWGMFVDPAGDPGFETWIANTNTTWNKITGMYRMAKGPLRLKVQVYDASDASRRVSAWATYYPRMNDPTVGAMATSQTLTMSNIVPWGTLTSGSIRYEGSGNASVAFATGSPAILEFEIPWNSIYNFAICPAQMSYAQLADSNLFGPGTVIINAGVENGGGATDVLEAAVWLAAGDDFHLSGFIGTPLLVKTFNFDDGTTKAFWPDSYLP